MTCVKTDKHKERKKRSLGKKKETRKNKYQKTQRRLLFLTMLNCLWYLRAWGNILLIYNLQNQKTDRDGEGCELDANRGAFDKMPFSLLTSPHLNHLGLSVISHWRSCWRHRGLGTFLSDQLQFLWSINGLKLIIQRKKQRDLMSWCLVRWYILKSVTERRM